MGIRWLGGRGLHTTRSIASMFSELVFNVSSHLPVCSYDFCSQEMNHLLFDSMRSVGPGRCLIDITDFNQCCSATYSVVPFSPVKFF